MAVAVANRLRHRNDTLKNGHKKALRRLDRLAVIGLDDPDLLPLEVSEWYPDAYGPEEEDGIAPFALLVWDNGLDYNMDGSSYQDSPPDYFQHSYHLTRKDAEVAAAYLEDRDPTLDFMIQKDVHVPFWDKHRIPAG